MRFTAVLLLLALSAGAAMSASDVPVVSTPLPNLAVARDSAVTAIDLRSHFAVPGISGPLVRFRTSMGNYNLELFPSAAPVTVSNFLNYVNSGRYATSIVHRVDTGLGVIQGGGYILPIPPVRMSNDAPIILEYNLPNTRGTISMARTASPNSATSEWFINTDDNTSSLGQANGGGYAVFGRVTGGGMATVDAIAALPVWNFGTPFGQLPLIAYPGSGTVYDSNTVAVLSADAIPMFPSTPAQTSLVTFAVSNSNPALLSASVSASALQLILTPGQVGQADLAVSATDNEGARAQSTFRVTVTCPYTLSQSATNLNSRAATGSFFVTNSSACSWTATTTNSWIHPTGGGSGDGSVSYTVDANETTAPRTGVVSVGHATFLITQASPWLNHPVFGWLYGAGDGWYGGGAYGWMWFHGGGQWVWSSALDGWIAVTDPNSATLWSTQFRWLTPSQTDKYRAETTAIGTIYVGKYNGNDIPNAWVVSPRFGYVWANGDGTWFWSQGLNSWLGVTADGGIWCVSQGRFL